MHNKPIEGVQPPKCHDIRLVKGIEKQLNNLTIEDDNVKGHSKIINNNNNNNGQTNNNHNDNHIDNNNKVQSMKIINDNNHQLNGDSHDNAHVNKHDEDDVCKDDKNSVDVNNGCVKHSTQVNGENTINDKKNTNGNNHNRNKSSKSGNKLIRSDALRAASVSPLPAENGKELLSEEAKDKNSVDFFLGMEQKDRLFVLNIEKIILEHYTRACDEQKKALEDKNNSSPPPLFSAPPLVINQIEGYKRMLIDRVCEYYRLVRTVEDSRKVIIYNNKSEPSEPFERKTTLGEHFSERQRMEAANGPPINRKILKRGESGSTANGSTENGNSSGLGSSSSGNALSTGSSNSTSFESSSNDNATTGSGSNSTPTTGLVNDKAHQEKAQRYEQVRSKIFQQDSKSENKVQTNGNVSYNNDKNSLNKRSSQQNNYNHNQSNSYQRRTSPRQSIGYQQNQQHPNNYQQSYGNHNNPNGRRLIGKQINNLNNNSKKNHSPTSSSASSNGSRNRFNNQQQNNNNNNQYHNQQFIPKNHSNFYQHQQQPQNRYRGYLNQYNAQQQSIPSNGNHYVQQPNNNSHNHNHNSSSLYSGTNALLPMPLHHYQHAGQTPLLTGVGQGAGVQFGSQRQQRHQTMQQQPLVFNTIPQSPLQTQAQAQAGQLSMHPLQTAQAHLLSQAMYNYHPAQVLPNTASVYNPATAPGLQSAGNLLAASSCATATSLSSGVGAGLQPGQDLTTVGHHQVPGATAIYYPMFSPLQTVPFTPVPGMQPLGPGTVEQRDMTHAGFATTVDEQNFFRQQQFSNYY